MNDFKFEQSKKLMQEIEKLEEKIEALENIVIDPNSKELSELRTLFAQKKHELDRIYTGCEGKNKL